MIQFRPGILWVLWLLPFLPQAALSDTRKFSVEQSQFYLDVPKNWQVTEKIFGLSLALVGPYRAGKRRVVISVVPTPVKEVSFSFEKIDAEFEAYKKGRSEWIKKNQGEVQEFFPYRSKPAIARGIHEFHEWGYRYRLGGQEFSEKTFYLICGKEAQLYHLKMIVPGLASSQEKNQAEKIIGSFRCES